MKKIAIKPVTEIPVVNLAIDTIEIGKQALVFVGTRPSAEKSAEEIAKKVGACQDPERDKELEKLKERILGALSSPTKQCKRLAESVRRGIAFHHSGLTSKQRELIEENFRKGTVKIICATPTLSAGVDLPAYRAIIRDLKRFGRQGYDWIPVLEYMQMAGRAGRPRFDKEGQAIILASSEGHAEELEEIFIRGEAEEIYSKLAAEPVLRTYVLSLISSRIVANRKELLSFFEKTFWAHQFRNMEMLAGIIDKMIGLLEEWKMITVSGSSGDFVSADELGDSRIKPTLIGSRVAELYIDPLTAHQFIGGLEKSETKGITAFNLLQLVSFTLEFRPSLRVKGREQDDIEESLAQKEDELLAEEPSLYDPDYEDFLSSIKATLFLMDWIDESSEELLLEKFNIRPGEIRAKLAIAEWLLYSIAELAKALQMRRPSLELAKLRIRVKNGVREELLPLLRLKGIGRARARKLYGSRIRTLADAKKADIATLAQAVGGRKIALDIKKQLGQEIKEIPKGRRKGQTSVPGY